ncbi:MAG: DUF4149 domain-containing protein [Deltaproteobacteria bacterium]|nr:DUF4149 domain-containing protein [Deltaproteobacteria bacterium]
MVFAGVKVIYLLALIVWLGEVVCVSFVAAPALFRVLAVADAGRAVSAIFPIYYKVGYACGGLLLGSALILRSLAGGRAWAVVAALAALMLAATLYAGVVVQPRAQSLRHQLHAEVAAPEVKAQFDRLHHLAVQLNVAVLLGGLAIAAITAVQLKP